MNQQELFERIERDFTYHPPTEGQVLMYREIREQARALALLLAGLCPISRELSLALTNLEQAVMWANAAIARSGGADADRDG
jgi:hypothetical protein